MSLKGPLSFTEACIKGSRDPRCLQQVNHFLGTLVGVPNPGSGEKALSHIRGVLHELVLLRYEQFDLLDPEDREATTQEIIERHPKLRILKKILEIRDVINACELGDQGLLKKLKVIIPDLREKIFRRIQVLQQSTSTQNKPISISRRLPSNRYTSGLFPCPEAGSSKVVGQQEKQHSSERVRELVEMLRKSMEKKKTTRLLKVPSTEEEKETMTLSDILEELVYSECNTQDCSRILYFIGKLKVGYNYAQRFARQVANDPQATFAALTDSAWGLALLEQGEDLAGRCIEKASNTIKSLLHGKNPHLTIGSMNSRQIASLVHAAGVFSCPKNVAEPFLKALLFLEEHSSLNIESLLQGFHASVFYDSDKETWQQKYFMRRNEISTTSSPSNLERKFARNLEVFLEQANIKGKVLRNYAFLGLECDLILITPRQLVNIEVDGESYHGNTQGKELYRDTILQKMGIKVSRIPGQDTQRFTHMTLQQKQLFFEAIIKPLNTLQLTAHLQK